jgi:hypothetical protein
VVLHALIRIIHEAQHKGERRDEVEHIHSHHEHRLTVAAGLVVVPSLQTGDAQERYLHEVDGRLGLWC